MADVNSRVLRVADWVPAREWADAPVTLRERYVRRACELAKAAKLRQIVAGTGADGRPLKRRKHPRADGADGKPLAPHYAESRSEKWCRAVPGLKGGTVTIYWSHSWGKILGFHARGEVPNAPVRNILDFHPAAERKLMADARHFWRGLIGGRSRGTPAPKAIRAPRPTPAPPSPARVPVAARSRVAYLKPGQAINPRSRRIQVSGG